MYRWIGLHGKLNNSHLSMHTHTHTQTHIHTHTHTHTHIHTHTMPSHITVANTAVLAADVPWVKDSSDVQTVKAFSEYYKRPWFDSVMVRCVDGLGRHVLLPAQLRLLFFFMDGDIQRQFAFVH